MKTVQADIGFILEGTYPYVQGGVSSWIHQIIQGLPDLTFAINFIGDKAENYPTMHYELPSNVIDLKCIYLSSNEAIAKPKSRPGNKKAFMQVQKMHEEFCNYAKQEKSSQYLKNVFEHIHKYKDIDINDFLYSDQSWLFITKQYEKGASDIPFLNYFWTVRAMHQPIFSLLNGLDKAVNAKVFHTISTGYAGLFGVMLHHLYKKKLILTEHGIYTKERKIDLSQADWIKEVEETEELFGNTLNSNLGYIRQLWIRFFEMLGKTVYDTADPIISISEGNKHRQIADGALAKKISVITNGINLGKLQPQRIKRPIKPPLVIGFIGRVVPIKDVKTFIRAMSNIYSAMPEIEAWIIGGEDEDPAYALECRNMITSLHLNEKIIYKGFCDVVEILPQLGCVVLSSISEGVPLVILEAFACGIPVISTDVGACRELIEGGAKEDRALGVAGAVVSISDSEQLAIEIVKLFNDVNYWKQLSVTAEQRADKYFGEQDLFASYQKIYQKALKN